MKDGKLQAKDLDDRTVLAVVQRLAARTIEGNNYGPPFWVFTWDLEKELGLENTGRLLLAKCEALIKKGLLDGCTCGCRGDFELTTKGEAMLKDPDPCDELTTETERLGLYPAPRQGDLK